MDRKRDIELIILEVLDCQELSDKNKLKFLKLNDESFSWRDLAKYQNLSALLPSIFEIYKPSEKAKEKVVKKLNKIIFGKENINHLEKFVPGEKVDTDISNEKIFSQDKIDWGSISVSEEASEKVSNKLSGFEEVKAKTNLLRKEFSSVSKHDEILNDDNEIIDDKFNLSKTEEIKKSKKLHKYVLVSILLFIVIASMSYYLLFNNKQETNKIAELSNKVDTSVTELKKPVIDNEIESDIQQETTTVAYEEVISLPPNKEKVLTKEPPKLPEPISAPLIAIEEVVDDAETNIEENISPTQKDEVIEETTEPTFFVAVEEMPQPIGGLQGIQQRIKYPEIALRAGVEGKVFIKAFVDEKGNVVNAEIVKGIGGGCDEAALDAVLKTRFVPGKQRGKPVKVQVTVPVLFKL